ncbi:Nitrilase family, member 2 [Seminavis robusta]|uniref:Nitrilase family, member 2 n=1 Tax=Seminavis robusta TaxID=568900 RepID=A0A9N8ECG8_9STRA|nr:Nitrilase family, member 2 [Seminavis robusta]|eukprot:Sro970_g226300.1 Nitrilase family, member 2 (303) ;mRNA; f:9515-10423
MSFTSKSGATYLGSGFTPGEKDVIVGRGKVCYKHSGNLRLAGIAQSVLGTYSAPEATKKSKTDLIKNIVSQVRASSPDGGFVKFDSENGQWFEVGDRVAREKVSQTFRDALTDQYKSSSTSKTLKRRQERITRQTSIGSTRMETTSEPMMITESPRVMSFHESPRVPTIPNRRSFAESPRGLPTMQFSGQVPGFRTPASPMLVSPLQDSPAFPGSAFTSPGMPSPGMPSPGMASASPSLSSLSSPLYNSGLGSMHESPSSLRLAYAIAERRRRLTGLVLAANRNPVQHPSQTFAGLNQQQFR